MREKKIVLPNVSLCSIVRDEKTNPAGGIQRFVESHVPFVEEAVIVDTGSIDGTREILEEMEIKYPNLKIYDHKFKGFGNARNYSLKKVSTKYALVLDADELITLKKPTNEWRNIFNDLFYFQFNCYAFKFDYLFSDGGISGVTPCWNTRLFTPKVSRFTKNVFENHYGFGRLHYGDSRIRHFLPSKFAAENKYTDYYGKLKKGNFIKFKSRRFSQPSQVPGFSEWKEYNPKRDNYE